jgi:hypothetical protein
VLDNVVSQCIINTAPLKGLAVIYIVISHNILCDIGHNNQKDVSGSMLLSKMRV